MGIAISALKVARMIPDFEYKVQEPLDETQFREERCYQCNSSNLSYKQATIGSIRCISLMKLSMAARC
ncbi:Atp-dependent protease subunit/ Delta 6 desaturase [Giardia duodenalis assemblage B]|uniref:Atp-dependent protease subunit/ Delta 6 desaturase n=1 Tax=Giardia duodenalis assemblage B TaxID=1394984 RepID=A0A132NNB6_GIAIN|nr:Atp-dependent protease subunit/ Delta 6 desaturase [Giardia intestinalis assemblage B]